MMENESVLTPQECRLVVKRYLQSENFEVLEYHEEILPLQSPTATFYSIIIKILLDDIHQEVGFTAKRSEDAFQFKSKDAHVKEVHSAEFLFNAFKDENEKFNVNFTPAYIFAKENIIVYKDMLDQGYAFPENGVDVDVNHIKLTLKTLAGYHAGCIVFEENKTKKLGKQYRLNDEYEFPETSVRVLESKWFKSSLKILSKLVDLLPQGKLTHEEFKNGLTTVVQDSSKILTSKGSFRKVLCHGYMWGNNVLFKYCNNKKIPRGCKLVNFELQHYNYPAFDVLQYIYSVTSREMRKQHFHEFIQFYYDCLKYELNLVDMDVEKLISLEQDLELSIHQLLPIIKLLAACFCQTQALKVDSSNENNCVVEAFNNNENFKKCMMQWIMELEDIIANKRLSVEDCFKIIKNKIGTNNYELLNYKSCPLSAISGYLGDHNKLMIDISVNNERKTLKLFAKFTPTTDAAASISNDIDAFYKEIAFYQDFIPKMKSLGITLIEDCVVPCYFTRQNGVLIFDDLGILNCKTLDPRKPYDYDLLQIGIKKLASLHSCSIILEEKLSKETGTKFRLNDHYKKELQEALMLPVDNHQGALCFQTGIRSIDYELDLFSSMNPSFTNEDFKIKIKKAYKRLFELVQPSNEFRNVICHGDLWNSNIMIEFADEIPIDVRFIDFQISRYCPPAHDLLTFLHFTTNKSTRKQHAGSLINLYYRELSKNLESFGYDVKEIYPYDNFMKSIEYMTPQAVCHTVVYYQLTILNSDILKKHMYDEESTKNVMLGDRRNLISDLFQQDPLFKERTYEALEDLQEMCTKYF